MFSDFPVCETIQKRRSVRTFDNRPLHGQDLDKLTAYAKELRNPFDIPVTVHLLETGDQRIADALRHEIRPAQGLERAVFRRGFPNAAGPRRGGRLCPAAGDAAPRALRDQRAAVAGAAP